MGDLSDTARSDYLDDLYEQTWAMAEGSVWRSVITDLQMLNHAVDGVLVNAQSLADRDACIVNGPLIDALKLARQEPAAYLEKRRASPIQAGTTPP
jgi:hypothetical protein